jgi:hypothetical protein
MLGGTAAARQVFGAAISQLGPLPQLYQQWITLEQQAQLIPAARAVLGVQDAVASGQAQQQQQPKQRLRRTRAAGGQMQDLQQQGSSSSSSSSQDSAAGAERHLAQLQQLLATLKAQALGTAAAGQAQGPSGAVLPSTGTQERQQEVPQQQSQWQQRERVLRQPQAEAAADMQQAEAQQQQQQQGVLQRQEEQILQQEMGFQLQQAPHQQQQPQQQMQHRLDNFGKKKKSSSTQHVPPSASVHVPSLVSAAVMEHRAGNLGKAQQLYEAALKLEPSNPRLLHSMVQMYLKEGDRAAAEQYLGALQVGGAVQLLLFLVVKKTLRSLFTQCCRCCSVLVPSSLESIRMFFLECGRVWRVGCMRVCAYAHVLSTAAAVGGGGGGGGAAVAVCRLLIQATASCATLVGCWRSRRGRWTRLWRGSHAARKRSIVSQNLP